MPSQKETGKQVRKEILTVREVAAALGVGPERVYQLVRAGELPSVRVGLKQRGVRIPRQAFEEYIHALNEAARASVAIPAPRTRSLKDIFPKDIFPQAPAAGEAVPSVPGLESIAEQFRPLAEALGRLMAPTPENQAHRAEAAEGFLMGLRHAALKR